MKNDRFIEIVSMLEGIIPANLNTLAEVLIGWDERATAQNAVAIGNRLVQSSVTSVSGLTINYDVSWFQDGVFYPPRTRNISVPPSSISYIYTLANGNIGNSTTPPPDDSLTMAVVVSAGASVPLILNSPVGLRHHERIFRPSVTGTNIIPQQNSGFSVSAGFTLRTPRNARCAFSGGYVGGDIFILGYNARGQLKSETIVASAGATVIGNEAWSSFLVISSTVAITAGTVDVQVGSKLGMPHKSIGSCYLATVDNGTTLANTAVIVDSTYGTLLPAVAPTGGVSYDFWYSYLG